MFERKQVIGLLFMTILLCSFDVYAGIYKCKDADGGLVFSQTPCPSTQKTLKVIDTKTSHESEPGECTYANKFAITTARAMKNGAGSDEVFNQYGGLDSVSKGTLSLINYVYVFRTNKDISIERIAALTQAKCQARGLGDVNCEELPLSFTDSLGGCDVEGEKSAPERSVAEDPPSPTLQTEQAKQNTEETIRLRETQLKARAEEASSQCKEKYKAQIDQLDAQMRRGYSSARGDNMREKRRDLRSRISQC